MPSDYIKLHFVVILWGFTAILGRLINLESNRTVSLQLRRNSEKIACEVKLVPESDYFNADLIRKVIGATLEELTPDLAQALGYNSTDGLVVSKVDDSSPADEAGLTTGIVVLAIDGQNVSNIVGAARQVYGREKDQQLKLEVVQMRRNGLFLRRRTGQLTLRLR